MSQAATIQAVLELNRGSFKTEAEKTKQELGQLQSKFNEAGGAVVLLQRQLAANPGNTELVAKLQSAEKQLKSFGREVTVATKQAELLDKAMGKGGGVQLAGGKRLRKGAMAVEGAAFGALGGGDLSQSVLQGAQGAAMGLQLSTGAMIGVAGAGMLAAKLIEARQHTKELHQELDALSGVSPDGAASSIESITARLNAAAKATKDWEAASSDFMHVYGGVLSRLNGHVSVSQAMHDQEADDNDSRGRAEAAVSQQTGRLVKRQRADLSLDQRAEAGDPTEAADRIRQKYKNEVTDIQVKASVGEIDPHQQAALVENVKQREALELRIEAHRQNATREALALEGAILTIKRDGADVEVKIAEARQAAAEATLAGGKQQGEEFERNKVGVQAATDATADARTGAAETKAENAEARRVAGMKGAAPDKERDRLLGEKELIRKQLDVPESATAVHDQKARDALETRRSQINAQLTALDRSDDQRGFQRRKQDIAADNDGTTAGKLRAIDKLREVNTDEQKDNDDHEKDVDRASRLKAEAAVLLRTKKDIEFSSKQELSASEATTQEMAMRATGHQLEAQLTSIRAQYEQRIAGYLRDGKGELAQQAGLQREMALDAARLAAYRRGPAGEMHDRAQAQADARDKAAMYKKHGRDLERARQGYEDDHRRDLPTDATARAKKIAEAVPDTWQKGVTPTDPQSQNANADGKDGGTVGELQKLYTLIDTRLKLTIP